MRKVKASVILAILLLMPACVPSLQPLFTEKDAVFEPGLVGAWVSEDEEGNTRIWTLKKSGTKAYELVDVVEDGEPAKFEARLVRLGERAFLDVYPEEPPIDNDFYKLHLIPAHTFVRITLDGDLMTAAMMDDGWLRQALDSGELTIAHQRLGKGSVLLTAATEDLQELVVKNCDTPGAFTDATVFRRNR
ncbi:MAG TPA: hypothetical protein VJH03_07345 [Blastocatellia bacterium]|nr:hypothetical protein [Blastocatellia bacterium]